MQSTAFSEGHVDNELCRQTVRSVMDHEGIPALMRKREGVVQDVEDHISHMDEVKRARSSGELASRKGRRMRESQMTWKVTVF